MNICNFLPDLFPEAFPFNTFCGLREIGGNYPVEQRYQSGSPLIDFNLRNCHGPAGALALWGKRASPSS